MKPDLSRAQWRKSSYSGNSGNCVEVADLDRVVAVRDSTRPSKALLLLTSADWRAFINTVETGMYDR